MKLGFRYTILDRSQMDLNKKVFRILFLVILFSFFQAILSANAATADTGSISFVRTGTAGSPTNNQYLSFPAGANYTFPGDFTVETWVKFSTLDSFQVFLGQYTSGGAWMLQMAGGSSLRLTSVPTMSDLNSNVTFVTGKWYHIALVRSGMAANNMQLYVNGVSSGQGSFNGTFGDSTKSNTIGAGVNGGGNDRTNGNMSNIRYVKGTAVYTSNFTPSTSPLTAISGTVLLLNTTNDANYLKDNSSLNATITAYNFSDTSTGIPLASAASPFISLSATSENATVGNAIIGYTLTNPNPTETYTATVVGGGTFSSPTNGISFDSTTGTFSGTPTATAATVTYRVTGSTSRAAATYSLTVSNSQTITFPALSNTTIGGAAPTLAATASSNLTVSYTSTTTGVCTVGGSSITIVATGTCSITASQAGDATYGAANNVVRSFTVSAVVTAAPTIKLPTLKQPTLKLAVSREVMSWGELAKLTLTGGVESGTVTYQNSGDAYCLVDPSTKQVLSTKYGTCIITAYNSGDTDYMQGVSNSIKILVAENTTPELDMSKVSSIYFASGTYYLNASSKSALNKIAAKIKAKNPTEILCYGFTDSKGGADNTYLSKMRSKSVADYLALKGVTTEITLGWYADSKPAVAGVSKAALAKNRRVEIYIK